MEIKNNIRFESVEYRSNLYEGFGYPYNITNEELICKIIKASNLINKKTINGRAYIIHCGIDMANNFTNLGINHASS